MSSPGLDGRLEYARIVTRTRRTRSVELHTGFDWSVFSEIRNVQLMYSLRGFHTRFLKEGKFSKSYYFDLKLNQAHFHMIIFL